MMRIIQLFQKIIFVTQIFVFFTTSTTALQIPQSPLSSFVNTNNNLHHHSTTTTTTTTRIFVSSPNTSSTTDTDSSKKCTLVQQKKNAILDAAATTKIGFVATDEDRIMIDDLTRQVEALNTTPNPSQSKLAAGTWRVRYSTAPSPSNGQLGPFFGTVLQSVDLESGIYANELLIGKETPWLSATLLADWDDLMDGSNWNVSFRTITLSLFGRELFTKEFDEGACRIWTTTFIDDDMRIVRAGPTKSGAKRMGKSANPADYSLFVMTTETKPGSAG